MSTIASIYDELVAQSYDEDRLGILSYTQGMAMHQIRRSLSVDLPTILDVGTGTGEALLALLHAYPHAASMVGLDVSGRMLAIAGDKLRRAGASRVTLVQDGAENVRTRYSNQFDLLLSHFILNYVGLPCVAEGAARALRPGGLWSLATTTAESFPRLQQIALGFMSSLELAAQFRVPASVAKIETGLSATPFTVIERHGLSQRVRWETFDELWHFAVHSGWFAGAITASLDADDIARLRWATRHVFPLIDEARIGVLLLRRT